METNILRRSGLGLSLVAMLASTALSQITRVTDQPRSAESAAAIKNEPADATAALPGPRVTVSKTAYVDGEEVCGVIRITNGGNQPATVSEIVDTLEVHFPRGLPAPSLPSGSTANWYKVADVPVSLPGPLAPGTSVNIDYCFSLCLTLDFEGANSMRNVVTIAVAGRNLTTRSVSFAPPVLDCQACCSGTGSCRDTVADTCAAEGGRPQGADTDCATIECPEACCLPGADHPCSDAGPSACRDEGGEPQGPGTICESTQCCLPLGIGQCESHHDCCDQTAMCEFHGYCCLPRGGTGCANDFECCSDPGVTCEGGKCCAVNHADCITDSDCCVATATCIRPDDDDFGTCCIRTGTSGCEDALDCCDDRDGIACIAGECCVENDVDVHSACIDDADCCDPNAICNIHRACCIANGTDGCLSDSDCCDFGATCEGGKCCAPNNEPNSCNETSDCCDTDATCNGGTCCVSLGASVCENVLDCCDDGTGTVICEAGKCCAPSGIFSSCSADADCCIESETCNLSGVCCVAIGDIGCDTPGAHCCDFPGSTIVCGDAGRCCGPTGITSSCTADSDCCDFSATCNNGTCCVRLGDSGCESLSDCCDDRFGMACVGEKCCVQTDVDIHSVCDDASDCCNPNATCNIHRACCIPTGITGCSSVSDCCNSGATCDNGTGRCCAENGAPGACTDSSDCCDGDAICNLNSTCCVPQFRSCGTNSDCCSGLCSGGLCESVIEP